MLNLLFSLLTVLRSSFKTRLALQLEIGGSSPSARNPAEQFREKAHSVSEQRPPSLGLAFSVLVGVAASPGHYSTENGRCLASDGLSTVLEMEESNWAAREARHSEGSSGPHSADGSSQSSLGSSQKFTANCSSWPSTSVKPRLPSTWFVLRNRPPRPGAPFSPIISLKWFS